MRSYMDPCCTSRGAIRPVWNHASVKQVRLPGACMQLRSGLEMCGKGPQCLASSM